MKRRTIAKFRNHARRMEKKLRAAGSVQDLEITGPAEFQAAYESLLAIERASWKESRGLSIHAVPHRQAFYREWGTAAAAAGRLHIQILLLKGEPIATSVLRRFSGCDSSSA